MYHNILQSLADQFVPVKKVTIRRQRLVSWMDDEGRTLRRNSRRWERQYRKSKQICDRLAWIQAETTRHRVYRRKENSLWNLRLSEQSASLRYSGSPYQHSLGMVGLIGYGRTKASTGDCPTSQDLQDIFNENIASVCRSTGGCPVKSALKHSMVTFDEFEEYSEDNIRHVIMSSQSKSCALDPLPTTVLKEFLPQILPFMADMWNSSLRQGKLPFSQRHAIVTPHLKKANVDLTDMKNYRPVSNLTFASKLVEDWFVVNLLRSLNESTYYQHISQHTVKIIRQRQQFWK